MQIKIIPGGIDSRTVLDTIHDLIEAGLPCGTLVDMNGNPLGEWGDE